jgi:hypothetical protein
VSVNAQVGNIQIGGGAGTRVVARALGECQRVATPLLLQCADVTDTRLLWRNDIATRHHSVDWKQADGDS